MIEFITEQDQYKSSIWAISLYGFVRLVDIVNIVPVTTKSSPSEV